MFENPCPPPAILFLKASQPVSMQDQQSCLHLAARDEKESVEPRENSGEELPHSANRRLPDEQCLRFALDGDHSILNGANDRGRGPECRSWWSARASFHCKSINSLSVRKAASPAYATRGELPESDKRRYAGLLRQDVPDSHVMICGNSRCRSTQITICHNHRADDKCATAVHQRVIEARSSVNTIVPFRNTVTVPVD